MECEELALIADARQDSEAFTALFTQYRPLVLSQIYQYHLPNFSRDDWIQEARLALLEAVERYDGSHGSQFGPYYKLVLTSHLKSVVRSNLAKKRLIAHQAIRAGVSESEMEQMLHTGNQMVQDAEANFVVRADIQHFFATLSPAEMCALMNRVSGQEPTTHNMARALERVRKKFTKFVTERQQTYRE